MNLKCRFEMVDMSEETIAVPVGKGANLVHGVLKLNATGKAIIELMNEEKSLERIIDCLSDLYEDEREVIVVAVNKVIDLLKSYDLLEE